METLINNYFIKLDEIKTSSINPNTTLLQIEALINDLGLIEENIQSDLNILVTTPTDFILLRKIILVEIEINQKTGLQSYLLNLRKTRENNIGNIIPNANHQNVLDYMNETKQIEYLIYNTFNNCQCMSNRKNIIENIIYKNV